MTRQVAPVRPPVVLTIAGSDAGGGAGIQADLKTIEAGGAFGTSAVTSVTAQNTRGVESTHLLPIDEIAAQIEAIRDDFELGAVKTGMLATEAVIDLVCEHAPDLPNLVVDPVMVAASGDRLLDSGAEDAYETLVAEATLVTPNADEAEVLTGVPVTDPDAAREAGEHLVEMGADAALVKGGHVPGDDVVDTLVTADTIRTYRHERVDTDATHGSGCTLSSAVATRMAHGDDVESAVTAGTGLLSRAVRYALDVGRGPGAVHHAVDARDEAARTETVEAVESLVGTLIERDARPLVPAGGTNVAGATPYAETPSAVAAVEGGIGHTKSGLRANRGVRFGVAEDLARRLVAAREADPSLRFALECRRDDALVAAFEGPSVTVEEGIGAAVAGTDGRPVAAVAPDRDRVTLLAAAAPALTDRVTDLLEAVE